MFVLPDVLSASIVSVTFIEVALSVTVFITELTEILNMILSYKSYLAFCMTSCIYIYIFQYVRTIFLKFLYICSVSEDAYVHVNSLYIKYLYNFFLPAVSSPAILSVMFVSLLQSCDIICVANDAANKV